MDYKYEKAIINQSELNRESGRKKNMELIDELKEVYRKAKAFDEVLDVSSWNAMDVGDAVHSIVREYEEENINE
ncbi:hypothetical protein CD149_12400 [Staphylococcus condimenti]|uniref:Uncharacterized protein n=1 Tax=Staphylococcus condimenti TaxID=70255 RepID=A0A143P9M3_9STAP|nr:hypothetical protein [Staphylococcus condimenti]AMY05070.1 hypothetical protein A4G25_03650 [Staphylococcus condimenti]AMY05245.1 hypothetical protein A4G25_04550 [Staphylococcus condimenti]APR61437.1 hypothetical protein BTZ13_09515 [Staphylococcus condimenti]PNZ56998.1 hypothetical protein CD149_12400 [Staphylococcus condimenti]QQS82947.1 hypothetical protein I6J05_01115 [Staphylococcus condimenti]